jgi:methylenetetrahydrofolate dehydrogenase (NADP+)/methenyltetrahydrofolate cyclohydrolase
MAKVINGKEIAEKFCETIKNRVVEVKKLGINPHIALINAGDDPASAVYVAKKEKLASSLGILSTVHKISGDASGIEISSLIRKLNDDENVCAILLQSPLPKQFKFYDFVNLIDSEKDVDGLTAVNQGKLFAGVDGVVPCTPLGVLHLLRTVRKDISGLHAVILGRSIIVGRPMGQLLLNCDCSVTTLHSRSQNIQEICRTADILIAAVGKPYFVGKEFIKPGAIVIDVGVNRIDGSKKIVGDVIFEEAAEIAEAITPVPGGVGPMTVAYLMHNALSLSRRRKI